MLKGVFNNPVVSLTMVTFKPSNLQFAAAAVFPCVGVFLALQKREMTTLVTSDELPRRLADREASLAKVGDLAEIAANYPSDEGAADCVSALNFPPNRVVGQDMPDAQKLALPDESVSFLQSGKKAAISSLRSRLLLEAAELALYSETR